VAVTRKPAAIFYWEAKRRFDVLIAFREKVDEYYAGAVWDRHALQWDDSDDTSQIRQWINQQLRDVVIATHFVGVSTEIDYAPPPAIGGLAGRISLLDNVFNLPRLMLPEAMLFDELDRAIGVYKTWLGPLWWKLFNPFYWLGWALYWVASIPFRILDAAGFDGAKAEGSLVGKIVRLLIQATLTTFLLIRALLTVFLS